MLRTGQQPNGSPALTWTWDSLGMVTDHSVYEASAGQAYTYPQIYGPGVTDRISKFTSHERDIPRRTDHVLARTYATPLQRFLSPDPGRDGWNLYGYAANNPVNFVDPDGRVPVPLVPLVTPAGLVGAAGFLGALAGWSLGKIEAIPGVTNDEVITDMFVEMLSSTGEEQIVSPEETASEADSSEGDDSSADAPDEAGSKPSGRSQTDRGRGANKKDRKQVDAAARAAGVDRNAFGKFIEKERRLAGQGGADNFSYEELLELADDFKEQQSSN